MNDNEILNKEDELNEELSKIYNLSDRSLMVEAVYLLLQINKKLEKIENKLR